MGADAVVAPGSKHAFAAMQPEQGLDAAFLVDAVDLAERIKRPQGAAQIAESKIEETRGPC